MSINGNTGELTASSYCIRKGLIRKAHLAHNLKKWNAKHPSGRLAKAVPETLIMVLDDIDYFEEALSDVYEVMLILSDPIGFHTGIKVNSGFVIAGSMKAA